MPEDTKPTTEEVSLPTGGSVAGIPGSHGPGRYLINWLERTITPIVDEVEAEVKKIEEEIHPPEATTPAGPEQAS